MIGPRLTRIRADLIHTPKRGEIERIADALVTLSGDGTIAEVAPCDAPPPDGTLDLRAQGVLLPGMVDLHIHAPQYPQLGAALDRPLEEWLQTYTFPLEARYSDLDFATEVYQALVGDLLAMGTTTAVYFATIHRPASLRLAEICLDRGQRAFVGRVAMDDPASCPDFYRDPSPEAAIAETRAFIEEVRALPGNDRVEPIITPRFIPSCTDAALIGLGQLAAETGAAIQTHVSESDWEHKHVAARCGCSDTEALDRFGLLTRRSVLAHGTHLSDDDLALIAARGAGVAHCPLSNAYFAGASFPLARALDKAVHVGLGTDIAGGPSGFLLENARAAVTVSRTRESGTDAALPPARRGEAGARIDMATAFWLATTGGAQLLDLPTGFFAPGQAFDAMLVRPPRLPGVTAQDPDLLQRIVMLAQPDDICATFVGGRQVAGATVG